MNKNLFNLQEDNSSIYKRNYTLNEFSSVTRNISETKDMEVVVRISLLAGDKIFVICNISIISLIKC